MGYIEGLDGQQKSFLDYMVKRMPEKGITNKYAQAAILAIVSKECNFRPKNESGYSTTSNSRIRQIFGKRVSGYDDAGLTALKKNPADFFNAIYGGRYGNAQNEGYKYRGRGFNQLTFKDNYKAMQLQTGHKIVDNPDLVNDPVVGTDVAIQYFLNRFKPQKIDVNGFTDLDDAVISFYRANAGFGKKLEEILKDATGGLAKSKERAPDFLEYLESKK